MPGRNHSIDPGARHVPVLCLCVHPARRPIAAHSAPCEVQAPTTLQTFSRLNPVSDPSAIIAYLRITELMQQGDRLLTQLSGEFPAVNGDLGGWIGKELTRLTGEAFERQAYRTRNVPRRIGLGRQHIHNRKRGGLQPVPEFLTGNFWYTG